MSIPTTRTAESGEIRIDYAKCNGCGLCVDVCADFEYKIIKGKVVPSGSPLFGCIACGQCMAICPEGALQINGRSLSPADLYPLPEGVKINYPDFFNLLQKRRSIREFRNIEISTEKIEKIIEAAKTAPMGIPPSDVNVLVISGRNKNHQFAADFSELLEAQKWFFSKWFIALMRPFWGKTNDELFRKFIRPLVHFYLRSMKKDRNVITYDAPLALYFYGTSYCDPCDPVIAATYAMLAAESMGLATCMIGAVHPFIQQGGPAEKFRLKYGIRHKSKTGLFVIAGYPKVKFKKGIRRSFANIDYV